MSVYAKKVDFTRTGSTTIPQQLQQNQKPITRKNGPSGQQARSTKNESGLLEQLQRKGETRNKQGRLSREGLGFLCLCASESMRTFLPLRFYLSLYTISRHVDSFVLPWPWILEIKKSILPSNLVPSILAPCSVIPSLLFMQNHRFAIENRLLLLSNEDRSSFLSSI